MKKNPPTAPKIALVYDWLDTQFGGAEYVLSSLIQAFPQAVLFTAKFDPKIVWTQNLPVRSSFIDHLPLIRRWRPLTALFSPLAFEQFDLSDFDIVISVTSFAAKGVLTRPSQYHLSYILTPPRFVYRLSESYFAQNLQPIDQVINWLASPIINYLKKFDQAASWRPDVLIPLSKRVSQQIVASSLRQPSTVCYPPIQSQRLTPDPGLAGVLPANYLLSVSRLVPYKRVDLAIQACLATNQKLLIVGEGDDKHRLIELAGRTAAVRPKTMDLIQFVSSATNQNIWFLSHVTEVELATLYQQASALLAIGVEDFGLTPLEAATVGTPALINAQSGVSEVLTEELSVHIHQITAEAVKQGLHQLTASSFNRQKLKKLADKFSQTQFISHWQTMVEHATKV